MVDEGQTAFCNGVANHFCTAAMAKFVRGWRKQGWQLPLSQSCDDKAVH